MSTPDELDALAKAMDSSKPWIVGLVLRSVVPDVGVGMLRGPPLASCR